MYRILLDSIAKNNQNIQPQNGYKLWNIHTKKFYTVRKTNELEINVVTQKNGTER